MIEVSILGADRLRPWHPVAAHWYPIYRNQQVLKEMGLRFRFFTAPCEEMLNGNVLFLSSDSLSHEPGNPELAELLERAQERMDAVVWFDLLDGTGSSQWHVLPMVSAFLKKQVLKDREQYQQQFYADRIYCDYFHKKLSIEDDENPLHALPDPAHTHKIGVSWNLGLSDFRASSRLFLNLKHDYRESAFAWRDPLQSRPIDLLGLFNLDFARATTVAQRKLALKMLSQLAPGRVISGGHKLPKRIYLRQLSRTKMLLSLFGCGELCFREFEGFMAGAAVLMPDVSHLETWPDMYRPHETYRPLQWDLSDLEEAYESLRDDEDTRISLARTGQELYRAQWTKPGRQDFCRRLQGLIKGVLLREVWSNEWDNLGLRSMPLPNLAAGS